MHEIVIAFGEESRLKMGKSLVNAVNKMERINKSSQMERNRSNFLNLIVVLIADQVLSIVERKRVSILGFEPVPFSVGELQMRLGNDLVLFKMIESGIRKAFSSVGAKLKFVFSETSVGGEKRKLFWECVGVETCRIMKKFLWKAAERFEGRGKYCKQCSLN
jgi:hypothetical protein